MYLLHRDSCNQLLISKFNEKEVPPYAILSHTWGQDEATLQDVQQDNAQAKAGYEKIRFCLDRARADGLEYCWVDTCCINQAEPTEVQDAIDRMFKWYRQAEKCYVYLLDVPEQAFENSRWFTRGWTLQELIAPKTVEFFSSEGKLLGCKESMIHDLEMITGVPSEALQGFDLINFDFEERLRWIRRRETKHEEDMVYSLFGILGVSIPLNYGEGRENAFTRLREQRGGGSIGEDARRCLHSLRQRDPRKERSRILATKDTLLEGSCDWVFRDAAFNRWWNTDDTPVLWIRGDPGKGKTMIMATLTDEISRRLKDIPRQSVSSFFFCQSTDPDLRSASDIIRGLVFLLAEKSPLLRAHAVRWHQSAGERPLERSNVLHSMWAVLMDMAQDPLVSRLYLLVDALDECDFKSLKEFLSLLSREAPALKKIKWVLSSRNIPLIEQKLTSQYLSGQTSLELNSSHVAAAVDSLIDFKVCQLAAQRKYTKDLQHEVREHLRANAGGTFLWVSLVCKELDEVPARKTRKVMKCFPAGLEPLYQRMLQLLHDNNDQEDTVSCKAILKAVNTAYRPLDERELGFIAGLDDSLASNAQTMDELIKLCGSFLTTRERKVYLVHQSAKDFFTTGGGQSVFQYGQEETHCQLAKRLLETMSGSLKKDVCGTGLPSVMLADIDADTVLRSLPLHVQYACCHWADHVIEGLLLDTEPELVASFLDKQFLFWLEALSVIQRVVDAIQSIGKLLLLLDGGRSDVEQAKARGTPNMLTPSIGTQNRLRSILRDGLRFVRFIRFGIEQAPLQVYSSGLVFAPSNCLVRQKYSEHIPGWITLLPKVEEEWNACLQTLESHSGLVTAVTFSPDGQTVASGSSDKTVNLWDAVTGSLRSTLDGHSDWVTAVAFSPDGQTVASGSRDSIVKLWDAATGSLRSTLDGHSGLVTAVAFSPDGQTVASGSSDSTVKLWDTATESIRSTLDGHSDWVNAVAFSPDGQTVASGSGDKTVKLWDAATGSLHSTLDGHSNSITAVAFSPDGQTVASGSSDSTVKLWDTATESIRSTLDGHSDWVNAVAFSPDGQTVASGSSDKTVKLWDTATGSLHSTLDGHSGLVTAVAFSPDGQTVASVSSDSTVKLWDTATGSLHSTLDGHSGLVTAVAFSPDVQTVAFGSSDKTVKLWDAATGSLRSTLDSHSGLVTAVTFSPDGQTVASGSSDKTVKLWDAATGSLRSTLDGHSDWVTAVAFSPDGQTVASGSGDSIVKLWDTATESLRSTLDGHSDWVNVVAFSPDGQTVASGSSDKTVKLWDAATGSLLETTSTTYYVSRLHFIEDGASLRSNGGKIRSNFLLQHSPTSYQQVLIDIFVEESWISYHETGLLWLPADYRTDTVDFFRSKVVLGRSTGFVTFIEIDINALP